MRLIAALAISAVLLGGQTERTALQTATAIRHWSLSDVTRIAVEVTGEFQFVSDRLHNPERIYFDIKGTQPRIDGKRIYAENIDDKLVKRVRVAETNPGVTRVVIDLEAPADVTTSKLSNPNRLIIELRPGQGMTIPTERDTAATTAKPPAPVANVPAPVSAPEPARPSIPPVAPPVAKSKPPVIEPTPGPVKQKPTPVTKATNEILKSQPAAPAPPPEPIAEKPAPTPVTTAAASIPATSGPSTIPAATPRPVVEESARVPEAPAPGELSKGARHTSSGQTSLVRALGLKVTRVVIDPGHGGHDQGTEGPKGLLEKDLVLDVAKRVGKMIEDKMGAEVIYTRTDDTFIPLEGRTALANEKRADLFLSIHANSSPVKGIAGVETYYLNFTDAKEALDVASRENASSQKSIFELRDIIQKITLHDKAEESKEFASRIQSSLYSFSSKNFPDRKNRGVKKAPFVVLIGANMPSVLAEVGFLSNAREEALLKKPDYRQRLAESLFRGLSKYADSLSHFQVAQAQE